MSPEPLSKGTVLVAMGAGSAVRGVSMPIAKALKARGFEPVIFVETADELQTVKTAGCRGMMRSETYATFGRKVHAVLRRIPILRFFNAPLFIWLLRLEARRLVKKIGAVASLATSDVGYEVEYFVATMAPMAVPQVTFDAGTIEDLKMYTNFKPFPFTSLQKTFVTFLPSHIWEKFPVVGPDKTMAWDSVIRTLSIIALGAPMHSTRKGGGAAKKLCLNGPGFAPLFRSYGIDENKFAFTGSPEHDEFVEFFRTHSREESLKELGLTEMPTACMFLQPFLRLWRESYTKELRTIMQLLSEHGGVERIILKAHPREAPENYEFLKKEFPKVVLIGTTSSSVNSNVFNVSDYAVIRSSTVGFQAIAARKALITYHTGAAEQKRSTDDFGRINVPYHAKTWERMEELIKECKDPANRQKIVAEQRKIFEPYVSLDGKANERIAQAVEEIALKAV